MDEIEFTEKEVTKTYVVLNGEEFPAGRVWELLDDLQDTDGFVSGVRVTGVHADIAEELDEMGIVGHSYSAGYYEANEHKISEMMDAIFDHA
jgi:hypothetical protein